MTRVVDEDGRFGKFIGRLEEALLFFAIFRQQSVAEEFHVHSAACTEHAERELSRAHL